MTTENLTTFRSWLRVQRSRADAVGDLARDVEADTACVARTADSLRRYIEGRGGSPAAVAAVARAADEWRASK